MTVTTPARHVAPRGAPAWAALGWVAFVALTLGASLAGRAVFAATELLAQWAPWDPGTAVDIRSTVSSDITDSLLPSYAQIAQRLGHGDLAGWSELTGPGAPLASTPSTTTLNPTVWPYLVLPLWLAPAYVTLAQLGVAAAGMALLLRRWGTGWAAGVLAGLVYCGSGFFVAWVNYPQASVAAYLPALLWSVERLVQRLGEPRPPGRAPRAARWAGAAAPVSVVVACLLLSGFPAVAGWALYAAGAYAVLRLAHRPWGAALGRLVAAGAAVAVGVALSAVQLLPFLAQLGRVSLDYRADGFTYTSPPSTLVTLLLPRVMADDVPPFTAPPFNAVESSTYLGAAALLLVLAALVLPRPAGLPRRVLGFLVVASVLGVSLIWFQNPLVTWIGQLPVFDGNPVGRLRAVLLVLLAALAGLGADALLRGERPSRRAAVVVGGLLGSATLAAGVFSLVRFGALTGYGTAVGDTALALGGVALVGLAVHRRRWVAPVLAGVLCAQAVAGTSFFWGTTARAEFYPQRTSIDHLVAQQGLDRTTVARAVLRPSAPALYGLRMLDSHTFIPDDWAALLRGINTVDTDYFLTPTITQLPAATAAQLAVPGLDRLAVSQAAAPATDPVLGTLRPGPEADGEVLVAPGGELRATIAPAALRALRLTLGVATPDAPDGSRLDVTVAAPDRATLVTGSRFGRQLPAGDLDVPLVGEDLPATGAGSWTVTLRWSGSGPLRLAASGGTPVVAAVLPRSDGLRLTYAGEGLVVYARSSALSRVRWASSTVVEPDEAARVRLVAQTPLDPATVVLSAPGAATTVGSSGRVRVTEDSGDTLATQVDATGAGYLVVADNLAPADWTVTVDGVRADLVVADQALAAVAVPAGAHTVLVRYTPAGQRTGAVLSAAAAALLVGAGLLCATVAVRARRRR